MSTTRRRVTFAIALIPVLSLIPEKEVLAQAGNGKCEIAAYTCSTCHNIFSGTTFLYSLKCPGASGVAHGCTTCNASSQDYCEVDEEAVVDCSAFGTTDCYKYVAQNCPAGGSKSDYDFSVSPDTNPNSDPC